MAVGHLNRVGEVSADLQARTLSVQYESSQVTVESVQEALMQISFHGPAGIT